MVQILCIIKVKQNRKKLESYVSYSNPKCLEFGFKVSLLIICLLVNTLLPRFNSCCRISKTPAEEADKFSYEHYLQNSTPRSPWNLYQAIIDEPSL